MHIEADAQQISLDFSSHYTHPPSLHSTTAVLASWCSSQVRLAGPKGSLLQGRCSSLWMKLASIGQQSTKVIEVVLLRILEYEKLRNLIYQKTKIAILPRVALTLIADQWENFETTETMNLFKQIRTVTYVQHSSREYRQKPYFEYHPWQRRQDFLVQRFSGCKTVW